MESLNDPNTHYGPLDSEVVDTATGTYFGIKSPELVDSEADASGANEAQVTSVE